MERIYAVNGQQPGFYLKCGCHWVKLTETYAGRDEWSIADQELATRFDNPDTARHFSVLFQVAGIPSRRVKMDVVRVVEAPDPMQAYKERAESRFDREFDGRVERIRETVTLPAMPDWFTKGTI